jgi:5-methyltetrahydrofolate--homocysteine methyltransferase
MDPQAADSQAFLRLPLDQALATRTADTLLADVVFPAMRSVVRRHLAGELILPRVLASAEAVQQATAHLRPAKTSSLGTILVATVAGDVHHVGKALLVIILSACGYTVVDLGSQVAVEAIVDAAIRLQPDAIGLSALLVSTSKQMPVCIQRLDARGVHVPVLVGGAAINRAFGRRAGVLPDGRVYEPGVFYCKDVFEGLATLDALVDPARRSALIAKNRDDPPPSIVPRPRSETQKTVPRRDVRVPRPPYWGARRLAAELREVWRSLDRNTLFRYHWGGYRVAPDEFQRLVRDVFEPKLEEFFDTAWWLEPRIVSGYFPCNADGDSLLIFDPHDHAHQVTQLDFPRQPDGEQLCLADYFRPVNSGERDVVVLQAVSAGPRAGTYIDELQRSGEYARMLYVSGLAAATAEALAEHAHNLARQDLGLEPSQGLRFSWGYPACPDLEDQRKVLPLLRAEEHIGLALSQSANLDPEHSTAALILHHPEAKYFAVRGAAA